MYTSGYPSGFHAHATSQIPDFATNYGHFEFWGPNGMHWNSIDQYGPEATWNASMPTEGVICGKLWGSQGPWDPNYIPLGEVCHNVY